MTSHVASALRSHCPISVWHDRRRVRNDWLNVLFSDVIFVFLFVIVGTLGDAATKYRRLFAHIIAKVEDSLTNYIHLHQDF